MPAGQPPTPLHIYAVQILTCDPTQRLIEAKLLADGRRVQITTMPVAARWPIVGETWTIEFRNNTPYLCEPYPVEGSIEAIPVGDAFINSPTGIVHVIGGDDSTDFSFSAQNMVAGGVLSGTYPNPGFANGLFHVYRAERLSAYTLSTAGWTLFPLDTVQYRTPGTTAFTFTGSKIKVASAGVYLATARLSVNGTSATGAVQVGIAQNGSLTGAMDGGPMTTDLSPVMSATGFLVCAANDTIEMWYWTNSGIAPGISNQGPGGDGGLNSNSLDVMRWS